MYVMTPNDAWSIPIYRNPSLSSYIPLNTRFKKHKKTLEATRVIEFLTWCYKYESAWISSVKETRPADQKVFFKDYGWIEGSL